MSTPETRLRILDAAETLFAEQGFAATSLRAITAEAEVNLAAVHYHFGSKEALFREVFARRVAPVNEERLRRLDELERDARRGVPRLEDVLDAFLRPALRLARLPNGRMFMRLAGRVYTEPGAHWRPVAEQFDEVKQRFLDALRRALPELAAEALFWRVHFMVGVMCHTLADSERLQHLSDERCDPTDVDAALSHLVPFLCAGFRAAQPAPLRGGRT